jgi:solute carrier family 25 (mitochondrial oxoglutarate transporter), member 11
MVLNTCQLASYSQVKELLLASGFFSDNIVLHSSASLVSGFLSTCVSMPIDIAKTRMQTMKKVCCWHRCCMRFKQQQQRSLCHE